MSIDFNTINLSSSANTNTASKSQIFTGWLGRDNRLDSYSFNLSGHSSLNFSLDGLSVDADLQLLDSNGSVIAGSHNYRDTAESIDKTLDAGNYSIQVYRVSGGRTNYNLKVSQSQVAQSSQVGKDWFDLNIQDSSLRAESRKRFADGVLDRNDMIAILREAKDSDSVDATEFTDLRTLVSHASELQMPEYVRVLSNKVVNGDTANQKYQGNTLGNLYAGSSDIQMENLINKWFLGSDRPQTSYTYQYANGSLFQNGISYQDVKQGKINDCFMLVGLAETAVRSSSTIESMFIDNGDNTFSVRFWHNGSADYVTVDRYLPTNSSGYLVYANRGVDYNNSSNELWVAFAEKAYVQLNESGWIYQDNTNTYNGLAKGGYISDALAQITGKKTSLGNGLNFSSIVDAFNSGQLIGLGTKLTGVASNIVSGHAYALINYNSSTQKFTLFNPWGVNTNSSKPGVMELSWSEIESSFSYWDSTLN
ncbi:peptidase [Nostocales cyanobacterium HT-58-2]|nr:peptidase [Nostocales cyanobacterium HT-58-2]